MRRIISLVIIDIMIKRVQKKRKAAPKIALVLKEVFVISIVGVIPQTVKFEEKDVIVKETA